MILKGTILSVAFVMLACHGDTITRARWEKMSPPQRALAVRSMIGHREAVEAKGGSKAPERRESAESYAQKIDAAYTRGDSRSANEIWSDLAEGSGRGGAPLRR